MEPIKFNFKDREGRFTSLAWFTAFNRPSCSFFLSDEKPSVEQIELAVLDICETAVDIEVRIIEDCEEKPQIFTKKPFQSIIKTHVRFSCEVCGEESTQVAIYKPKEYVEDGMKEIIHERFSYRCKKHLISHEDLINPNSAFSSTQAI